VALIALAIYMSSRTIAADAGDKNRTIYISHLGVLKPWGYMPITGINLALVDAIVDDGCDPPELVLTTVSMTRYGEQRREVHVPIPKGHKKDIRPLVAQLKGQSISNAEA
jgi:hypothetical protein